MSRELERGLVSAGLRKPDEILITKALPEHFQESTPKRMWAAMRTLAAAGKPVDLITVHQQDPSLDRDAMVAVLEDAPVPPEVSYLDRELALSYRRRTLASLMQTAAGKLASMRQGGADEIRDTVQDIMRVVSDEESRQTSFAGDVALSASETIQKALAGTYHQNHIVKTGIRQLDDLCSAFIPGSYAIIAGRPSFGKTTLMRQMAMHVSESRPVLFFSVEESGPLMLQKILCAEAGVSLHDIMQGKIPKAQQAIIMEKIAGCMCRVGMSRLYVNDAGSLDVGQVRFEAMKLRARAGDLAAIFIDYLQIMRLQRGGNRNEEIGRLSQDLKTLAKDLKTTIIVASQLSRSQEQRSEEDSRPRLSDLRDSGCLEQDADVVVFVWGKHKESSERSVFVAKQRNGPCGEFKAWIDFRTLTFSEKPIYGEPVVAHGAPVVEEFTGRD